MLCPLCDGPSGVLDTRGTRRRRECRACGHRWSTQEVQVEELRELRRHREHHRRRVTRRWDTVRGFSVPDHLRDRYFALRDKKLSARQAGEALGLIEPVRTPLPDPRDDDG